VTEIAPRSRRSWIRIGAWIGSVLLWGLAILSNGRSPTWLLVGGGVALVLIALAWRRKAATVPGAIFATSAASGASSTA